MRADDRVKQLLDALLEYQSEMFNEHMRLITTLTDYAKENEDFVSSEFIITELAKSVKVGREVQARFSEAIKETN